MPRHYRDIGVTCNHFMKLGKRKAKKHNEQDK